MSAFFGALVADMIIIGALYLCQLLAMWAVERPSLSFWHGVALAVAFKIAVSIVIRASRDDP